MVLALLGLLLFLIILISGPKSLANAIYISYLQLFFLLISSALLWSIPNLAALAKRHRTATLWLTLWVIGTLISFFFSPLNLENSQKAWDRLLQTFLNLLFFIYVWDLFSTNRFNFNWLLVPVVASLLLIEGTYLFEWYESENGALSIDWWRHPPFFGHARHVGYIASITTIALLTSFFVSAKRTFQVATFCLLVSSATLLFWLGGRGAMLAVIATLFFVIPLGWSQNPQAAIKLIGIIAAMILGILLAEVLAVFPWNGLLQSLMRSVEAGSLDEFSTSRVRLWMSVIDSLQGHWLFGLGAQAYIHMPNHIYGNHPHSFIMQIIVEWGIIGLITIASLAALLIRKTWHDIKRARSSKIEDHTLVAMSVVLTLGFHGLIDGTLYYSQTLIYFLVCAAILAKDQPAKLLPHGTTDDRPVQGGTAASSNASIGTRTPGHV